MRRFVLGLAIAAAAAFAPAWALAGDQEIADDIVKQLREQKAAGQLVGFGIDLEIDSGTVWLKGHVASAEQLDLVLDIARNVEGVEEVVNDLNVQAQETKPKSSERKSLLRPLRTANLVEAPKQLFSALRGEEAEETSAAPARTVSATAPASSDEKIAQTIIAKLREQQKSGALRGFSIDVNVDQGTVWLKGTLADDEQRTLVLEIARRVRGVVQVVNDLSISSPQAVVTPVSQPTSARSLASAQGAPLQPMTMNPAPVPAGRGPVAFAPAMTGRPVPMNAPSGVARARYDHPTMPGYAWPSYAAYPNYGAVTYPKQYSPSAWPYIGPFYPYPQVPLGWRKVAMEWKDGWWFLDFKSK